jgi:hypothetical protein
VLQLSTGSDGDRDRDSEPGVTETTPADLQVSADSESRSRARPLIIGRGAGQARYPIMAPARRAAGDCDSDIQVLVPGSGDHDSTHIKHAGHGSSESTVTIGDAQEAILTTIDRHATTRRLPARARRSGPDPRAGPPASLPVEHVFHLPSS